MNHFVLFIMTLIVGLSSPTAFAKITGTVKKEAMLRQLSLSLQTPLQNLNLPTELISKLPVKNDLNEINPVFINAWTQLSFLACSRSLKIPEVENQLKKIGIRTWLSGLFSRTMGRNPQTEELDQVMKLVGEIPKNFTPLTSDQNIAFSNKLSMACSLIFTHPEVYLTHI